MRACQTHLNIRTIYTHNSSYTHTMRPIASSPREAAMNLIFLDTPPTTDQELPTTIISRAHTETTAPTTLASIPPRPPTNKITVHIEGVRDVFGAAYSFENDGRRVVQLETGPLKDRYCYQNWSNLSHYVVSFAVGLYNPNTGIYVNIENAGPIRIDTTHFKDILEEDVSWRAVYGEFYDFSLFNIPHATVIWA
ncbi:hypothetical protein TWF751_012045 [Orbilia oligospora]|nr:hypothetical protein TWF751_012045 [Orbilia oligospora]